MTAMADHMSPMTPAEFERFAAVESETVRLEFIDGRIGVEEAADGDHGEIIMWLITQCMRSRPDLALNNTQGLKVEKYREGRARPDGSLVPVGHFAGQGEWADLAGVLMTVEVTSYDSDTGRRDRKEKPRAYADVGIPVYLLIDRDACTVSVFSVPDPDGGRYRHKHTVTFGERVSLPEPVGIELDTEILKNYVR
ncbi:Uma2 family endonuclease [Streptomyces sp. AK02-01A]|uniref:Uma2 family endonuclease n=1 Tax=Streptomyces sp. AK02-01A TaxID=3028648 RepID=UPI0029ABC7CB|nr:Uma2 family endonuclease [Streptomyces sp. AK02-01A]MDX3854047.1 Uma2 family endonuclease [Streptomyces sp. AK02-01A]